MKRDEICQYRRDTDMQEEEKIKAGVLFCPGDSELKAIKLKTHNLNVDDNSTHEDETQKRAAILSEFVGEFGEGGFIQGPIAFHYGKHTSDNMVIEYER